MPKNTFLLRLVVAVCTFVLTQTAHVRSHIKDATGTRQRLLLNGRRALADEDSRHVLGQSFFFKKKIVRGCIDKKALNYKKSANEDDGSCVFPTPRSLDDDGRFKFYRSDMDEESPFFVSPELRRLWRNAHFDRGTMTTDDVEMTPEQKLHFGLEQKSTGSMRMVLPVGEPIPQKLDNFLHKIEQDDIIRSKGSGQGGDEAAADNGDRETAVPITVMGMPADIWPNPVNVPEYRSVPV